MTNVKTWRKKTPKDVSKEKCQEDIKEINSGLTNYKHMKKLIITDEPMIKTSTAKIKRHEEMSKILAEEGAIK